jgi:chromate reductase
MKTRKIAVLVGSLRKASFTKKLAESLAGLAPASIELEIVEIGELPFYNEDVETAGAPAWVEFRDRIQAADGVLFCTPEYNRSMPAALKNAIDVGSRPYGEAPLQGKPCAVVSTSAGQMGGFGANHAVRQAVVFLNMPCMQAPEAYVGGIGAKFEGDRLADESTRGFLTQFMAAFAAWVERHASRGVAHR